MIRAPGSDRYIQTCIPHLSRHANAKCNKGAPPLVELFNDWKSPPIFRGLGVCYWFEFFLMPPRSVFGNEIYAVTNGEGFPSYHFHS